MSTKRALILASLSLLAIGLVTTTVIAGADEDVEIRIHKKIIVDCESDGPDCAERSVVFIDADGERHEITSVGDVAWVHGPGHRAGAHTRFLMHHGMKSGFLGVGMAELTPELRAHFGVPEDAGVMVSKVVDDSPASRAGIAVGDIITLVDGETVRSGATLAKAIRSREDGAMVDLEVWRDGSVLTFSAAVEERAGRGMRGHGMLGHGGPGHRMMVIDCDDDEDCDFDFDFGAGIDIDFDCGGAEDCRINVECKDGDCDCTVNDEATDCSELPGFHADE